MANFHCGDGDVPTAPEIADRSNGVEGVHEACYEFGRAKVLILPSSSTSALLVS